MRRPLSCLGNFPEVVVKRVDIPRLDNPQCKERNSMATSTNLAHSFPRFGAKRLYLLPKHLYISRTRNGTQASCTAPPHKPTINPKQHPHPSPSSLPHRHPHCPLPIITSPPYPFPPIITLSQTLLSISLSPLNFSISPSTSLPLSSPSLNTSLTLAATSS